MKPIKVSIAELLIFEPWELPEEWIDKKQEVEVFTFKGTEKIVIRLKSKITYSGKTYEYFVGTKRNVTTNDYNLIRIDEEKVKNDDLFDLSWWHGGDAFIGSIE